MRPLCGLDVSDNIYMFKPPQKGSKIRIVLVYPHSN